MARSIRAPDAPQQRPRAGRPWEGWNIGIRRLLPLILALAQTLTFAGLIAIAYHLYPAPYSPLHNTLSQLGNPALNPNGSMLYRTGCLLGGGLMSSFFLSLGRLQRRDKTLENAMLTGVQLLGVIAGLGLVLLALYPDNESQAHHIALGFLANGFLAAVVLSLFAFRRLRRDSPAVTMGSILTLAAIGLMFAIPGAHWAEWIPAVVSQAYTWVLGFHTSRIPIH